MSRVHCLDCEAHVVVDPGGYCPAGHAVGAAGTRVDEAIGSRTPHPDEPEPWVARIDPEEVAPAEPEAPRVAQPRTAPGLAPAAPAEPSAEDLFAELGALGDDAPLSGFAPAEPAHRAPAEEHGPPPAAAPHDVGVPPARDAATPAPSDIPDAPPAVDEAPPAAEEAPEPYTTRIPEADPSAATDRSGQEASGPPTAGAADRPVTELSTAFDELWGNASADVDGAVGATEGDTGSAVVGHANGQAQGSPPTGRVNGHVNGHANHAAHGTDAAGGAPDPGGVRTLDATAVSGAGEAPRPDDVAATVEQAGGTVRTAPAGDPEAREALSEISALEAAVRSLSEDAPAGPPSGTPASSPAPAEGHGAAPAGRPAPPPPPPGADTAPAAPPPPPAPGAPTGAGAETARLRRDAFADVAALAAEPAAEPAPEPPAETDAATPQEAPQQEARPAIDTMNFTAKGGRIRRSEARKRRLFGR